jgi:hypothetical protein
MKLFPVAAEVTRRKVLEDRKSASSRRRQFSP